MVIFFFSFFFLERDAFFIFYSVQYCYFDLSVVSVLLVVE